MKTNELCKETDNTIKINLKKCFFVSTISAVLFSTWIFYFTPAPPSDFGSGSMFDKIAPRYDLVNRILSLNLDMSWRRVMIEEILDNGKFFELHPNGLGVLDLATGTADVAILLGKAIRYQKKSKIIGVDPSQQMIEIGKSKVSDDQLSDIITLQIGDALNLREQFKPNYFDAVTMSFGLRNVPDRATALCEIHRVLRKTENSFSKLFILEFSEPSSNDFYFFGFLAKCFIRYIVPVLGATFSGAPREYMHLQKSIREFPSPKEFVNELEELKCMNKKSYRVQKLIQMNFGTVQLYVILPL